MSILSLPIALGVVGFCITLALWAWVAIADHRVRRAREAERAERDRKSFNLLMWQVRGPARDARGRFVKRG